MSINMDYTAPVLAWMCNVAILAPTNLYMVDAVWAVRVINCHHPIFGAVRCIL